jgi:hypothetical protein
MLTVFSLLDAILIPGSGFRILITNTNPDPGEPFHYGSESEILSNSRYHWQAEQTQQPAAVEGVPAAAPLRSTRTKQRLLQSEQEPSHDVLTRYAFMSSIVYLFLYCTIRCIGIVMISIRIWIQHFMSICIRNWNQVFSWQKWENIFFSENRNFTFFTRKLL